MAYALQRLEWSFSLGTKIENRSPATYSVTTAAEGRLCTAADENCGYKKRKLEEQTTSVRYFCTSTAVDAVSNNLANVIDKAMI